MCGRSIADGSLDCSLLPFLPQGGIVAEKASRAAGGPLQGRAMGAAVRAAAVPADAARCDARLPLPRFEPVFVPAPQTRARQTAWHARPVQVLCLNRTSPSYAALRHRFTPCAVTSDASAAASLLQRLEAAGALWSEFLPDDAWLMLAPPGFEDSPAAAGCTVVSAARAKAPWRRAGVPGSCPVVP